MTSNLFSGTCPPPFSLAFRSFQLSALPSMRPTSVLQPVQPLMSMAAKFGAERPMLVRRALLTPLTQKWRPSVHISERILAVRALAKPSGVSSLLEADAQADQRPTPLLEGLHEPLETLVVPTQPRHKNLREGLHLCDEVNHDLRGDIVAAPHVKALEAVEPLSVLERLPIKPPAVLHAQPPEVRHARQHLPRERPRTEASAAAEVEDAEHRAAGAGAQAGERDLAQPRAVVQAQGVAELPGAGEGDEAPTSEFDSSVRLLRFFPCPALVVAAAAFFVVIPYPSASMSKNSLVTLSSASPPSDA
eukprot:CAMPEP_0182469112 /NCGR_PEP_ID=MMETSP1319-20130603/16567_1 /TAXON_ID=172717 /ORGANISM="Bolidomonas pacifica, Strain RCC208" /LENGTH=303 /DNA_ID=CAMNT_0024669379 /DNA_START=148 /DNA_END=1056 /DNA_ORIENTATION=-